jgi:hypothetical protein
VSYFQLGGCKWGLDPEYSTNLKTQVSKQVAVNRVVARYSSLLAQDHTNHIAIEQALLRVLPRPSNLQLDSKIVNVAENAFMCVILF